MNSNNVIDRLLDQSLPTRINETYRGSCCNLSGSGGKRRRLTRTERDVLQKAMSVLRLVGEDNTRRELTRVLGEHP